MNEPPSNTNGSSDRVRIVRLLTGLILLLGLLAALLPVMFFTLPSPLQKAVSAQGRMISLPTMDLIEIVQLRDTRMLQLRRKVDRRIPSRVRWIIPPGWSRYSAPPPDSLKLGAIAELGARTNESLAILPVLIGELKRLKPTDPMTGEYVNAIALHGKAAGAAVPWFEEALVSYASLQVGGGGRGSTVGLSSVLLALEVVSPEPRTAFDRATNLLARLCFPPISGTTDESAVANQTLQPAAGRTIDELTYALSQLRYDHAERVRFLETLLASPVPPAQMSAWTRLVNLDSGSQAARDFAFDHRGELAGNQRIYLRQLMLWARDEPELISRIEPSVVEAIVQNRPGEYWMLVDSVGQMGSAGHRFVTPLVQNYFSNRVQIGQLRYGLQPQWESLIREAEPDLSGLLRELQTSASDPGNPVRFDDAQVYTQLGGDRRVEIGLLQTDLADAAADIRKAKLNRFVQLAANPEKAAEFLARFLRDPEPQVRRQALFELAALGSPAAQFLGEIDQLVANDPSTIVCWQAKRTANTLRGVDPNMGLRDQAVSPGTNQE